MLEIYQDKKTTEKITNNGTKNTRFILKNNTISLLGFILLLVLDFTLVGNLELLNLSFRQPFRIVSVLVLHRSGVELRFGRCIHTVLGIDLFKRSATIAWVDQFVKVSNGCY